MERFATVHIPIPGMYR